VSKFTILHVLTSNDLGNVFPSIRIGLKDSFNPKFLTKKIFLALSIFLYSAYTDEVPKPVPVTSVDRVVIT
jgi:hypothetical protein